MPDDDDVLRPDAIPCCPEGWKVMTLRDARGVEHRVEYNPAKVTDEVAERALRQMCEVVHADRKD